MAAHGGGYGGGGGDRGGEHWYLVGLHSKRRGNVINMYAPALLAARCNVANLGLTGMALPGNLPHAWGVDNDLVHAGGCLPEAVQGLSRQGGIALEEHCGLRNLANTRWARLLPRQGA